MKACIQGRLISGRYRFQRLRRHFTSNEDNYENCGWCILPSCILQENKHVEGIESFFLSCPSLKPARVKFEIYKKTYLTLNPHLEDIIVECMSICPTSFFLDCSTMPPVIAARQMFGEFIQDQLFRLTRHFCFLLHESHKSLLLEI